MTSEILSNDLRRFINRYIDSVVMLDTLLFFLSEQKRSLTTKQVADELRSGSDAVQTYIKRLVKAGLLSVSEDGVSYQYAPKSEELNRIVGDLSRLYPQYRSRVIDQIYSPQRNSVQDFADAFKLKQDDEDG